MLDYFSDDYFSAREAFIAVAKRQGYTLKAIPLNDELSIDIAYHLPANVDKAFVTNSGTHGTEGLYGSAVQTAFLDAMPASQLPSNVGLLFIHALNPYGVANTCRVNEEGVDLNRNFINFNDGLPQNPGYKSLADALVFKGWQDLDLRSKANKRLNEAATQDRAAYLVAVFGGQYDCPEGLFYGGKTASWSNLQFHRIVNDALESIKKIAFVDLHTGYGGYGQVAVYSLSSEESEHHQRVKAWHANSAATISSPYPATGSVASALFHCFPKACLASIVIECGTMDDIRPALDALRAEHSFRAYRDFDERAQQATKVALREAFYPSAPDWRETVCERSLAILRDTLAGLVLS